jgi:hypothetical protein
MPETLQATLPRRRLNRVSAMSAVARLSRQEHANRINGAWRKTKEVVFETGRHLLEAKAQLDKHEFEVMLNEDLLMSRSTATKLMGIASNKILCSHVKKLPASWATNYELSLLKDEVLLANIENGKIHPKMERWQAEALRNPARRPVPDGCPICSDTARVPPGHQWSDHDDIEEQSNTLGLVEDLVKEIEKLFGGRRNGRSSLRQKIEHVRNEQVHPEIRAMLAEALREHAGIATRLANELRPARHRG